ncbi:MAG: hypothetical protein F6K63_25785 [Moorea sp. SIO1G6]|uniref:hypothetical protein n=1 Tax=unclassified Moorena TaxID=2683338 RepID=UPI0013BB3529|nr:MULTISPECIES: hypothetical protein [unclassified Moorena]NEQ08524.1 hypothetical protein [Moorena sp. SIO4E2]NEQ13845.1 hypothetical protein [Moorena sp. SIO3E2]NES84748.1 hypothetical protein [Moorena sp. SIO2B7]NET67610.1 hypothetical protein [Moorena sp. SIO1G6]
MHLKYTSAWSGILGIECRERLDFTTPYTLSRRVGSAGGPIEKLTILLVRTAHPTSLGCEWLGDYLAIHPEQEELTDGFCGLGESPQERDDHKIR